MLTAFKHFYTSLTMTPHTEDPPLIEAPQPIHKIAADHALSQPIGQLRKPHIRIHPIPEILWKNTQQEDPRVTIDDQQRDFYSSEEDSSNSEGDSDHLN